MRARLAIALAVLLVNLLLTQRPASSRGPVLSAVPAATPARPVPQIILRAEPTGTPRPTQTPAPMPGPVHVVVPTWPPTPWPTLAWMPTPEPGELATLLAPHR